jgi:hypothetical protein
LEAFEDKARSFLELEKQARKDALTGLNVSQAEFKSHGME